MRYESPELLDRLAAEYVLGTLRGPARTRFERLCAASEPARKAALRWEDDFSFLSRILAPVEPSAHIWPLIARRLALSGVGGARGARRWRWSLAAAAGLAAVGLIFALLVYSPRGELQTVAVLGPDAAHPQWRVERPKDLATLTIRVVGSVPVAKNRDFELWALPRGGNPVSLGLLPQHGTVKRPLTSAQRAALLAAEKVAVSLEPVGGSPTGNPTGPIVVVRDLAHQG